MAPSVSRITAFLAGFALAGALAGGAAWVRSGRSDTTIDLTRPTIVQRIQELHRLETVVFAMDKIVAGGAENAFLPAFLAGDRLLLLAYGEVAAGVDFAEIDTEETSIEGRSIRLTLPPASLLVTRIDNARTRVYSRETGLFTPVDPHLETEVRRMAEQQIEQAALEQGILRVAADNARTTLSTFLTGLGFEEIEIR